MYRITTKKVESLDDVTLTAELANTIWHQHYKSILSLEQIEYMVEQFQSTKAIAEQIEQQGYHYELIFDKGIPCGFYAVQKQQEKMFLSKIYIKEEHRKKGIGGYCIKNILAQALQEDCTLLYLTVNKFNSSSIAAYRQLGFLVIESIQTDIGNGFIMDDYVMQKKLQ